MLRAALLLLLAAPAAAQTPMSAEAFEAYSTGKTLYFGKTGAPYGAEQYLSGRRVIWTFLDGECQEGHWFEQAGDICFVYDLRPDAPQCWTFYQRDTGLAAQYENDPSATPLIEVEQSDEPLQCPGPDVGA